MIQIDLDKIKMGMILSFRSDGGWSNNQTVRYQRKLGFGPPACYQTHVGMSLGGPYMISARLPKSGVDNILEEYQGRQITFLYWRGEKFRDRGRYKVATWAASRANLPYGWPGLLGFWVRESFPFWGVNPLASRKAPFCSLLGAWALRREGIDPWPGTATDLITPAHFLACPGFETIDVSRRNHIGGD